MKKQMIALGCLLLTAARLFAAEVPYAVYTPPYGPWDPSASSGSTSVNGTGSWTTLFISEGISVSSTDQANRRLSYTLTQNNTKLERDSVVVTKSTNTYQLHIFRQIGSYSSLFDDPMIGNPQLDIYNNGNKFGSTITVSSSGVSGAIFSLSTKNVSGAAFTRDSSDTWLTLTSTGGGNHSFSVTANTTGEMRRGRLYLSAQSTTGFGAVSRTYSIYQLPANAKWSSDLTTVTFTPQNGDSATSKFYDKDTAYTTLPTPTRTGYTFNGWYTASAGGTKVTPATSAGSNTHTLYAQWTSTQPATITVTFNAQGGTAVNSKTYTANATYGTLPATTRAGYTFNGWYTASAGGTKVTATTSVGAASHTLYAQWTAATFTVTFNAQGGTAVNGKTYSTGNTYGTLPASTRTGYTFNGWYTASTGGTKVTASTSAGAAAHTLYAQWTSSTLTVTFNSQGGTSVDSETYSPGDTYDWLPVTTRSGYTFNGWYTTSTGGKHIFEDSSVGSTSHTLYAQWEKGATHDLQFYTPSAWASSFYLSNASATKAITAFAYGDPVYFSYAHNDRLQKAIEGPVYSTLTLTGTGIEKTYMYYIEGEIGAKDYIYNKNHTCPILQNLPIGSYTLTFTINSRNTVAETSYTNNKKSLTFNVTAPAGKLGVTFDPQGGELAANTRLYSLKAAYGTLPAPTRTGYIFAGWFKAKTGGSAVTPSTSVGTATHTLYARWSLPPSIHFATIPQGTVGVYYTATVTSDRPGVTFSASGLPPGLTIDPASGAISGVPAKAGTFPNAAIRTVNKARETDTRIVGITIAPMPAALIGTYNGTITPCCTTSQIPTGSISLTISATGKITAKETTGGKIRTWTINGIFDEGDGIFYAYISGGNLPVILADFYIDTSKAPFTYIEGTTVDGDFTAERNAFIDKTDRKNPAVANILTTHTGYHTLSLFLNTAEESDPASGSYLTATIGANGTAKWAGKLTDGTAVSGTSPLFADGTLPCFFQPYRDKAASLAVTINSNGATLLGKATWICPLKTETGDILATLTGHFCGGRHDPAFNLAKYDQAEITADYSPETINPDLYHAWLGTLATTAKGALTLPPGKAPALCKTCPDYHFHETNPMLTTFTYNAKTGIFTGKFNLYTTYQDAKGLTKLKTASVQHTGILNPLMARAGFPAGSGFYRQPASIHIQGSAKPTAIQRSHTLAVHSPHIRGDQ